MIDASMVASLNERLAAGLGRECGGSVPRFAWKWAPDQPWFVYDRDDRTVVKKTWAHMPGSNGQALGRVWVLAQWRPTQATDHCGYGEGVRIAVASKADYFPYLETALPPGRAPSEMLNHNYIWAIRQQLDKSAESREDAFEQGMAEEKYSAERNSQRYATEHLEASRAEYDRHTGAFGNLEPGKRDGWMSFQNVESGAAA